MSNGIKIATGIAVGAAVVYFGGRYLIKSIVSTVVEGAMVGATSAMTHAAVNSVDQVVGATFNAVGDACAEANKANKA